MKRMPPPQQQPPPSPSPSSPSLNNTVHVEVPEHIWSIIFSYIYPRYLCYPLAVTCKMWNKIVCTTYAPRFISALAESSTYPRSTYIVCFSDNLYLFFFFLFLFLLFMSFFSFCSCCRGMVMVTSSHQAQ